MHPVVDEIKEALEFKSGDFGPELDGTRCLFQAGDFGEDFRFAI